MGDLEGTFAGVASAVVFAHSTRLCVTVLAKVCVGTTAIDGSVATVVTFVLNVAQTVLVAHKLLRGAHFLQPTSLALHMVIIQHIFFSIFDLLLNCTVHVAAKERFVAYRTLVEFTHMESKFLWLLEESVCRIMDSSLGDLLILLQLSQCLFLQVTLKDSH